MNDKHIAVQEVGGTLSRIEEMTRRSNITVIDNDDLKATLRTLILLESHRKIRLYRLDDRVLVQLCRI